MQSPVSLQKGGRGRFGYTDIKEDNLTRDTEIGVMQL